MRKPTLVEFAQIAEVVAAVAVIVSLVYLGWEVRSNTAAIRAASLQAVSNASSEILLTTAADSTLSRIRQMGSRDLGGLSEAEEYRYGVLLRQQWLSLQNVYFQNELEVIDPRVWRGYSFVICDSWSNPGVRASWSQHRHVLDSGFVALVEDCPVSTDTP